MNAPEAREAAAWREPHIVGIIPAAPGWWAIWRDASGEERFPVAAWALLSWGGDDGRFTARGGFRDVEAMVEGEGAALALPNEPEWRGLVYDPSAGAKTP